MKSFKYILLITFLLPFLASATLLDVSEDINDAAYQAFVTFDDKDWAWVSPVNAQFDACLQEIDNAEDYLTTVLVDSDCANQLLAPGYREGWRFATSSELDTVFNILTLFSFYDFENSMFIQATEYWNTNYINIDYSNFQDNLISGEWSDNTPFETFYIRDHLAQSVPEPSTLIIFVLGLFTLLSRKKLFS
ncbi:MAG: PEP-CTERM sorting domain-containing protein [Colwellia sp.]|nr:PEP-CTERM sorting domain-containing protein [Colwellia sp.]